MKMSRTTDNKRHQMTCRTLDISSRGGKIEREYISSHTSDPAWLLTKSSCAALYEMSSIFLRFAIFVILEVSRYQISRIDLVSLTGLAAPRCKFVLRLSNPKCLHVLDKITTYLQSALVISHLRVNYSFISPLIILAT